MCECLVPPFTPINILPLFLPQELFGGYDGIKLLVQYLKRDAGKFSSGLGHHRLQLAATDCVWCTVMGTPVVEDIFLENEGVFVLLDLLRVISEPGALCPSGYFQEIMKTVTVLFMSCTQLSFFPHLLGVSC